MKKMYVLLALMLLLLPCWPASAEVVDGIVYGETTETGTGVKGPYNPYTITGYLPEQVTVGDMIYGMPEGMAPLYSLPDGTRDEYNPVTGLETRRVGVRPLSTKDWLSYSGVCCQYLTNDNVKVGPFLSTHFIYVEDGTQSIQYGQCTIDARTGTIRWHFYIDEYYSYMPFFLGDYGDVYVYYAMQEPSTTQHTPVIIGTATTAPTTAPTTTPTTTTTTSGGGGGGAIGTKFEAISFNGMVSAFGSIGGFFTGITDDFLGTITQYPFFAAAFFLPLVGVFIMFVLALVQQVSGWSIRIKDDSIKAVKIRRPASPDVQIKGYKVRGKLPKDFIQIDGHVYYRNDRKGVKKDE